MNKALNEVKNPINSDVNKGRHTYSSGQVKTMTNELEAWEIVSEKNVNLYGIKQSKNVETFNTVYTDENSERLDEYEFNKVKGVLESEA